VKTIIPYIIILVLGIVIGALCRGYYVRDEAITQRDTVTVYKTIQYSRLELQDKTIRLQVPDIHVRPMVFIPADSVSIIYRDSIRYITLPRQNYYTKTDKAQIWHSGVDSTIDSLSLLFPMTSVVQTERVERKPRKHAIGIGIEANYNTTLNMPVQLEYTYNVKPWLSVYGYAEYELFMKQFGIGVGIQLQIEW
jgi:hypothetical protein